MNFFALINGALRVVGIQVVRASTFDSIIELQSRANHSAAAIDALSAKHDYSVSAGHADRAVAEATDAIQDLIRYVMKSRWQTIDLIETISEPASSLICPLCNHHGERNEFKEYISNCIFFGGRLVRHQCPNCDVIFGPQKMFDMDPELLDFEYRNLYRIYSEGNTTDSAIRTFHLLKPKKSGVYLDFGCGGEWSESIRRLRAEGWNIYGFEPSAKHSAQFVLSKWEELAGMRFDGIMSHNVIEHLLDPVETNSKLQQLLTKDGLLVHATACFEYKYEFSRFHLFFLKGRSMEIVAKKAGMEIVDWVRDGEFIACTLGASASNNPSAHP